MFFTAATVAFLSAVAASTPTPTSTPQYPPRLSSESFRLIAHVTSNDLTPSLQNNVLTSYHTAAGLDYAVLTANQTAGSGRIFYTNGTVDEITKGRGNVLSDEGTPLFPAGVVINPPSPSPTPGSKSNDSEVSVSINGGQGSPGVGITRSPDKIANLYTVAGEGFYACQRTLRFGPAIQLFVKQQFANTPQGCADLVLLPQCSESDGLAHPSGELSGCYADVAGTDWSAYPL